MTMSPAEPWDDLVLGRVLQSVGEHLDTGDTGVDGASTDVDGAALAGAPGRLRRSNGTGRRRLAVAAAVVALVMAATVVMGPTRRAIGGWLGVGPVGVRLDPDLDVTGLDELAPLLDDSQLVSIDPDLAADALGRPVPALDATSLGPPEQWWEPPESGLLVGWDGGATTLWLFAANADVADYLFKFVPTADAVTDLPDLGDGGVAISGDHLLRTPRRDARATNVVVWSSAGLVWRLESAGPPTDLDALVQVAGEFASG